MAPLGRAAMEPRVRTDPAPRPRPRAKPSSDYRRGPGLRSGLPTNVHDKARHSIESKDISRVTVVSPATLLESSAWRSAGPLNVDLRRRSNVSNAQIAAIAFASWDADLAANTGSGSRRTLVVTSRDNPRVPVRIVEGEERSVAFSATGSGPLTRASGGNGLKRHMSLASIRRLDQILVGR